MFIRSRYLKDVLPLDNKNSRSGLKGLDMLAVFDPWIKDDTGLVLCDGPRHVSGSDWWFDKGSLEVTWMYWSMEDAKYKDVDSILAIVPLNEAAIGLKESDKATYVLLAQVRAWGVKSVTTGLGGRRTTLATVQRQNKVSLTDWEEGVPSSATV
ncbi:hypothetical protein Tco_0796757 [Tanacetum coccineum]